MPVLAGWLTGEQVPQEMIEQVLLTMGNVPGQHDGQLDQSDRSGRQDEPVRMIQPGAGLLAFAEPAYATRQRIEPPVLDWSPDRRTLVYRRPLSGAHPLYYIENWPAQGNLLFASEIKALFAVGAPRRLHLPALAALLRYGFMPAPWTAFQDIHIIPAGSILRWQRSKTIVNAATNYSFDASPPSTGSPDILDQLSTMLDNTTDALLPPHEQLVALTRGDSGSALVLALAAQHTETPFTVASLGYKKSSTAAEQLADAYQLPSLAITGVDQPEFWLATLMGLEAPCTDSRPLAWHQLLHTISVETGARVALTGQGAASLLDAVTQQAGQSLTERSDASQERNTLHSYAQMISPSPMQSLSPIWSAEAAQLLREAQPWEETHHARKLARQAEKLPDAQRWHYLDLHLRLPDQLVGPAHQLAIQERIALRSPYLIPDIIRLLTNLPPTLADGTPRQAMLTTLAKRYFPAELLAEQNVQTEIIPSQSLLHRENSALLQQTLSVEALLATRIFDVEAVEDLLREGKQAGAPSRELVLMFTTQLLCKLFEVGL